MNYHNKQITISFIIILWLSSIFHLYQLLASGFPPPMLDFKPVYTAARLFPEGVDPYCDINIKQKWQEIENQENLISIQGPGLPYYPFIYPPYTVSLFYPFAVLNWGIARYAFYLFNFILFAGMIYMIPKLGGFLQNRKEMLIFILFLLAFKGTVQGLLVGQLLFTGLFLCLLAVYFEGKNKPIPAALCLVGGFIKPTIAIPFLLYFLLRKKWKEVIGTAGLFIFLNLLVLIKLPVTIFSSYLHLIRQVSATGGINDYSLANFRFFDQTVIQSFIYYLLRSRPAVSIITGILLAVILWFLFRNRKIYLRDQQLFLTVMSFLSLIFLYHRVYDILVLSVIFWYRLPSEFIRKPEAGVIFLFPLILPFNGILLKMYPVLPQNILHLLMLNIPVSLFILFLFLLEERYRSAHS